MQDLVKHLLVVNPVKRFSVSQCRAHPWLSDGDDKGGDGGDVNGGSPSPVRGDATDAATAIADGGTNATPTAEDDKGRAAAPASDSDTIESDSGSTDGERMCTMSAWLIFFLFFNCFTSSPQN